MLRPQAENLAPLYWMQQKQPDHFANIQDTLRQIAPFFEEFRLAPSKLNEEKIRLEWKEKGNDAHFNASSLSDGTLRFLCLTTLLLLQLVTATVTISGGMAPLGFSNLMCFILVLYICVRTFDVRPGPRYCGTGQPAVFPPAAQVGSCHRNSWLAR